MGVTTASRSAKRSRWRAPGTFFARFCLALGAGLLASAPAGASRPAPQDIHSARDLFYREVLFQYYRDDYLDAITHLLAAREQARLESDDDSELMRVGIELSYGLHENASQVFESTLKRKIAPETRDRIWLSLARTWLRRGYDDRAAAALARVGDRLPAEAAAERAALQARIALESGAADAAAAALDRAPAAPEWKPYARYNRAVALFRLGQDQAAAQLLERLGKKDEHGDAEYRAVRDRADVALGDYLLRKGQADAAAAAFGRVAPDSPLYGQAQLGLGHAAFDRGETAQAIAVWSGLGGRGLSEPASRDALLLLAYARWRMGDQTEAAAGYRDAIAALDGEGAQLDATIAAIRDDASLAARVSAAADEPVDDAAALPEIYSSPYLADLVASDGFAEAWGAYRDLRLLRHRLEGWAASMSAFETMLATRREGYTERLPQVRERLAALDVETLRRRLADYGARLDAIERDDDAFGLADAREQGWKRELDGLSVRLAHLPSSPEVEQLRTRARVLRGLVGWQVEQAYPIRRWEARKHLAELADAIDALQIRRDGLEQAQSEAPARFEGFDARIAGLGDRIAALQQRLTQSVAAHERYLQTLAVAELERQKHRLDDDRARARHQLAQLLDDRTLVAAGDEGLPARQEALAAWQAYLSVAADEDGRREAMRRIPDLQLAISEEAQPGAERDDGFQAAIQGYKALLERYPGYSQRDDVDYQVARAYEGAGDNARSVETLASLAAEHRDSSHYYEAEFRIGEDRFSHNDYPGAEQAYRAVLAAGPASVFYEQARYKHGWSEFRLGRFEAALDDFDAVLAAKLAAAGGGVIAPDDLPRAQRELADDALRAASLSFDHLGGAPSLTAYFARRGPQPYEYLVYARLADLYLERERPAEAAQTLSAYVAGHPDSDQSPLLQVRVYEVYEQAGLKTLAADERRAFLDRFGPRSAYWKSHELERMPAVAQHLRQELLAMAQRAHAEAQHSRRDTDYAAAARWYRDYIEAFPKNEATPGLSFLLGELLTESGRYAEAIASYERSAYDYGPHPKAAEAGYAALLGYDRYLGQLTEGDDKTQWRGRSIDSALRFADRFPDHPQAAAVLTQASQGLLALQQPDRAVATARRVLERKPEANAALRLSALMVIGAARFDAKAYGEAEEAYAQAVPLAASATPETRAVLTDRLAAAIYKQGEAVLAQGDPLLAARHFLRVSTVAPGASIAETADYDGAAALISAADWDGAVGVLETFRRKYPDSHWQSEVTSKLALAHLQAGRPAQAADELARIARDNPDRAVARDAAWQSAELYAKAGDDTRQLAALERYVAAFPQPLDRAVEARWRIAELYRARGDEPHRAQSLRDIVEADDKAGAARTDAIRDTAARAALALAEPLRADFDRVHIQAPLERSLKAKKQAMEKAIGAFRKAAGYGVASVTTAATFDIAEIYHDFSRAMLDSQRPADLSGEEREQYDVLLEEQAYPFEEQSIKLHEVNFRRIAQGVYDEWVRASMDQLAVLVPARYAKTEKEVPFVEDIR